MKSPQQLLEIAEQIEEKGDYERAERLYKRALLQQIECFGIDHDELEAYFYNLGMIQCALEHNHKAIETLEKYLRIAERRYGLENPDVLEVQSLVAGLQDVMARADQPAAVNS